MKKIASMVEFDWSFTNDENYLKEQLEKISSELNDKKDALLRKVLNINGFNVDDLSKENYSRLQLVQAVSGETNIVLDGKEIAYFSKAYIQKFPYCERVQISGQFFFNEL